MSTPRRFNKGWKETRRPEEPERPFHVRAQYSSEQILGRAREMMGIALDLSKVAAALMRKAQEMNDEARNLARMAQTEAAREKARAEGT